MTRIVPSSRVHSQSSAARMMCGSLSWLTGSDARASQASALAVTGSRDRREGLKACPYKAARASCPAACGRFPGSAAG